MPSQLYYHGEILTMDGSPPPEAVLVKDGLIAKTGSFRALSRMPADERIDLKGAALLPGFIDAHSHITSLAASLRAVSLADCRCFEDIVAALASFIKTYRPAPGSWIFGFGYDHNTLREHAHPTAAVLNKASESYPILVTHASGHMGVCNSLALRTLGVTAASADPPGGKIGRDASGEPDGYLEEAAFMACQKSFPQPDAAERKALLSRAQDVYFSYGITTAQDGLLTGDSCALLADAAGTGELKIDVVGYADLVSKDTFLPQYPDFLRRYCGRFKIGGYKIFLDGSPQGKTAWMSSPYLTGGNGYPAHSDEEVLSFVQTACCDEMQLLAHCNGDAACEQYLSCSEAVLSRRTSPSLRPVMIHAQTVRDDQLSRMKLLCMIPSYFAAHVYYWGDVHIQNLGEPRAAKISPVGSTARRHMPFTLHQDSPVIPPNMLETVWCAVNRQTRAGVLLGPEQAVSPFIALCGVTVFGAYQYFEEQTKGTIAPGKVADFVILGDNPLRCPSNRIKDIRVIRTVKAGQTVYQGESL